MPKHTPGKWTPRSWGQTISIDAPDCAGVAFINPHGDHDAGTPSWPDIANARLIAAAPEMAELLRVMLLGAYTAEYYAATADARALLARIEGE